MTGDGEMTGLRRREWLMLAPAVLWGARGGVRQRMEEVMGRLPHGRRNTPRTAVLEETDCGSYVRRKFVYTAEEGDDVPAYLLLPKERGRRAAMLCLHQTVKIGKAEPAGLGGNPNLHYAQELAERGYIALAPDYPGFGDYQTDVYARGYASATMKGIWNHMRAVDLLASMPQVNRQRIGAIGHSLGGHNSLFVATFDPRIRAVVSSCGFTSFRRYMGGDLTGWTHKGYMPRIATMYGKSPERMPFDFSDILRALKNRRVFVNAPLHDANFDVRGVRECVAAAGPGRITVEYPDCAHEFPPAVREKVYGWLGAWR